MGLQKIVHSCRLFFYWVPGSVGTVLLWHQFGGVGTGWIGVPVAAQESK